MSRSLSASSVACCCCCRLGVMLNVCSLFTRRNASNANVAISSQSIGASVFVVIHSKGFCYAMCVCVRMCHPRCFAFESLCVMRVSPSLCVHTFFSSLLLVAYVNADSIAFAAGFGLLKCYADNNINSINSFRLLYIQFIDIKELVRRCVLYTRTHIQMHKIHNVIAISVRITGQNLYLYICVVWHSNEKKKNTTKNQYGVRCVRIFWIAVYCVIEL